MFEFSCAREMGVLKIGTVALDGLNIHANANRHSALSYDHAGRIEAQLRAEVASLMARAEATYTADVLDGVSIPDERALCEERLRKLAEARARDICAQELAGHEAKLAAQQAKTQATGKKPGGKPPEPKTEGPLPKDQVNLSDEESRIMLAAGSLLAVAVDISHAANDKQQIAVFRQ